jgi:hypothetical protein
MLRKPSPRVSECLQRAADCELKAESATDPQAKRNFLFLATQWRRLAESHEYLEQTGDFLRKH